MNKITEEAYSKALDVLKHCAKPEGFFASGLPGGYEAVWSRDSMTTALGAAFFPEYKEEIKKSLELLTRHQTELGLIPNCVGSYNTDRQSDVTFNSLDAPLWYIIGHYIFAQAYEDASLLKKHEYNILKALFWLKCQDPDALGLVVQQPTGDWQDAFPHKYGYTIHGNALFYAALRFLGENESAENLKDIINGETRQYISLYDKKLGYYYPWGWKNHDGDREHEEWFDTLGNLLAIVTGLATPKIANNILKYITKEKINKPYPVKATWPPMSKNETGWKSYFEKCNAREPYNYLNAGIWPMIGSFYVVALVKMKKFIQAEKELSNLAKADLEIVKEPDAPQYIVTKNKHRLSHQDLIKLRQKEFNEWLHGKTGQAMGEPYQAWSAGSFIYAAECVKRRKVLYF